MASRGTGLGLPICQNLLRMMGSALHVESQPGQGSRFWFEVRVPVAQAPAEYATMAMPTDDLAGHRKPAQQAVIGFQGEPVTILIVDDHETNRAVIRDLVKSLGFTILEAGNGFDGLEKVRLFAPDVVLMDLMMPVLDGFSTTRQLRQQPEADDTLIIGISATITDDMRQRSLEAGCDVFLPKPIDLDALLEVLQQHLGLEWLYAEHAALLPESDPYVSIHNLTLAPPSQEQLAQLFELARGGDIAGLRAVLPGLAAGRPALIPFVDHLYDLVKGFYMNDIKSFLGSYLLPPPDRENQ